MVDTAQRGNVDGCKTVELVSGICCSASEKGRDHTLTTDGTSGTDTGGVLTRAAVDDGVDGNLDGVLVGHDVDLQDS